MFKTKLADYTNYFEENLNEYFDSLKESAPSLIKESMKYAVMGGGKRIRPVLCFAANEMLGGTAESVKYFALAIEFIHSYSLVHDDLPAMDNDDFRRGKPSTHKQFGESFGILAGDALLNLAFETALLKDNFSANDVNALKILADYAGYSGMIAGQVLDLQNEKAKSFTKETLYDIYLNKTAKLLMAPLLIASCVNNGLFFEQLKDFGYHLGIMFQISDDIMDIEGDLTTIGKTPNKDIIEDKLTSIKAFGLEGAKQKLKEHYEGAISAVSNIPNNAFLIELTDYMYTRKK